MLIKAQEIFRQMRLESATIAGNLERANKALLGMGGAKLPNIPPGLSQSPAVAPPSLPPQPTPQIPFALPFATPVQMGGLSGQQNTLAQLNQQTVSLGSRFREAAGGALSLARGVAYLGAGNRNTEELLRFITQIEGSLAAIRGAGGIASALGMGQVGTALGGGLATMGSRLGVGVGQLAMRVPGLAGAGSALVGAGGFSAGTTGLLAAAPVIAAAAIAVLNSSSMQSWLARTTANVPWLGRILGGQGVLESEQRLAAQQRTSALNRRLLDAGFTTADVELRQQQEYSLRHPFEARQRALQFEITSIQNRAAVQPALGQGQVQEFRFSNLSNQWMEALSRAASASVLDRPQFQAQAKALEAQMRQMFQQGQPGTAQGRAAAAEANANLQAAIQARNQAYQAYYGAITGSHKAASPHPKRRVSGNGVFFSQDVFTKKHRRKRKTPWNLLYTSTRTKSREFWVALIA